MILEELDRNDHMRVSFSFCLFLVDQNGAW